MGPGPWSEPLEVVSGAGPPDAPHSLHLACRGPHSVHLAWEEPINNGAAIEQYSVQVAEVIEKALTTIFVIFYVYFLINIF